MVVHRVTAGARRGQQMQNERYRDLLNRTCEAAIAYLDGLRDRPVGRPVDYAALLRNMGGALPQEPEDAIRVVEQLSKAADPGVVATPGPRYFGFVTGGALPAAVAAEWLAATWDQNAFSYVLSPAAAAAEEVARQWLIELFGLSREMSLGFTTGATMANFTALAAARHALLRNVGWDVEEQGLPGAPVFTVVTSDESHVTIFAALQMLGLGRGRVTRVAADEQGRMRADALRSTLAGIAGPVLVCAQAGNVNTGAFDPLPDIAACVHDRSGWLHVDGAFGMWAAASPAHAALVRGAELADSIAVDCHKWLNVPYDSGLVFVRDQAAHQAAMTLNAPYYGLSAQAGRENHNWVPEASRHARGFAVWAALRSLGRGGIAAMVERCCALARRMAERLREGTGVEILNEVVLNQVLVRFSNSDERTAEVIRRVQEDGTCWAGGTTWHSMHAMRISVSNWSTVEADIDRSADAILKCAI
jgi:glutamate/tyrosine decarboxylase-like PLP-dependent enzyme